MTRKIKNIEQLYNNPKNVVFLDIDKILLDKGYERRQSGKGSSHYVYSHPKIIEIIVLVSHGKNDVIPEYQVKKAIRSIKMLENEK